MKILDRYYFDFNATAPLSQRVSRWLQQERLPYGNPGSIHTAGKWSWREIEKTRELVYQVFGLTESSRSLFFHSGASEGISTLLKGFTEKAENAGQKITFFYFSTDHICIHGIADWISLRGHRIYKIGVDTNGNFDDDFLVKHIKSCATSGPVLLNYTWVNNETGVVFDLARAVKIKEQSDCFVHVDGVQSVGKIEDWRVLPEELDAYTFSGHKFGAIKGIGASLITKTFPFKGFIPGQRTRIFRGGTENLFGILSFGMALQEVCEKYDIREQQKAKLSMEDRLATLLGKSGEIVARKEKRNGNTICFILYKTPAQISTMAFDMSGIDVGSGSACASGTLHPSDILTAMGYSAEKAKSAIRLSFSSYLTVKQGNEYFGKIKAVLGRFL